MAQPFFNRKIMKNKFVLFDFDGVIADSFETAFGAYSEINPRITKEYYRSRFEGNVNDWDDPDKIHLDKKKDETAFFEKYWPRFGAEVKLFPGIKAVLASLAEKYKLVIISSTLTSQIEGFLKKNRLDSFFAEVWGNDIHTSKVEKIKMVFEKFNISPDDCVFITDTLGDVREADETGVGAIGVTWGFHNDETLLRDKSFGLVHKPSELPGIISDYFNRFQDGN
ncbi:MAG: HAD hydrolase-like protein [bacterium]|nr:HAD hydrolase-like protein [bacterium]